MKKDGVGGANTKTGLRFERDVDLLASLKQKGFVVRERAVYGYGSTAPIAHSYPKHKLYTEFLEKQGIDYSKIISRKLLPDEALYVPDHKRLHVIEKKYQETEGSVDEKLQTCDYKKTQYEKLCASLGVQVTFTYVLNDWFKDKRYGDVLAYIEKKGCRYYFFEVPLGDLDLPESPR